jgi:hypothetical protein
VRGNTPATTPQRDPATTRPRDGTPLLPPEEKDERRGKTGKAVPLFLLPSLEGGEGEGEGGDSPGRSRRPGCAHVSFWTLKPSWTAKALAWECGACGCTGKRVLMVPRPGPHGWAAHHSRGRHAEPEPASYRSLRRIGEHQNGVSLPRDGVTRCGLGMAWSAEGPSILPYRAEEARDRARRPSRARSVSPRRDLGAEGKWASWPYTSSSRKASTRPRRGPLWGARTSATGTTTFVQLLLRWLGFTFCPAWREVIRCLGTW